MTAYNTRVSKKNKIEKTKQLSYLVRLTNEVSFILLIVCLFLAPSNLFLKLLPTSGYVNNLQVDYLIPKLHASWLFAVMFLILRVALKDSFNLRDIRGKIQDLKHKTPGQRVEVREKSHSLGQGSYQLRITNYQLSPIFHFLLPIFLVRQLFVPFPLVSVWNFINLFVLVLFFRGVKRAVIEISHPKKLVLIWFFYGTLLFQAVLGAFQFFNQRSFTGFFPLGEVTLRNQPYLARGDFFILDQILHTNFGQRILPYGTLPHPNVLAGFLAIGIVIVVSQLKINKLKKSLLVFPLFLTLLLTLSFSAWIALVGGLLFIDKKWPRLSSQTLLITIGGLFLLVPLLLATCNLLLPISNPSLSRRVHLNQAGLNMFIQNPWLGVGFNQFTAELENVLPSREVVSFIQPAHHVGILFLAENGVLGLLLVFLFIRNAYMRSLPTTNYQLLTTLFFLLPIFTLDHYLYTLIQGWWLVIIAYLFLNPSLNSRP